MNPDADLAARLNRELNRLAKWRTVFAGWQLGTRPKTDPETQAVRDTREAILCLRVEVSALVNLLTVKNVFTVQEYQTVLLREIQHMQTVLEARFPGFKATESGMLIDVVKAAETTKGWKP